MKIAIAGSMHFSPEMLEIGVRLTEKGHIVELPAFTREYSRLVSREEMHSESVQNKITHDLMRYYFDVIKNQDALLAVNKAHKGIEGYIGGNTFLEMGFAHVLGKRIYLLHHIPEMGYTDELRAMNPIVLNGDLNLIAG